MRFKKGDLLTTRNGQVTEPLVRVEMVTREGVVHCVNLLDCQTMKAGHLFQFTPTESTRYQLHSKK